MKNAILSFGIAAGIAAVMVLMGAAMQPAETASSPAASPTPPPGLVLVERVGVRGALEPTLYVFCDLQRGNVVYAFSTGSGGGVAALPGGCRGQMEAAGK